MFLLLLLWLWSASLLHKHDASIAALGRLHHELDTAIDVALCEGLDWQFIQDVVNHALVNTYIWLLLGLLGLLWLLRLSCLRSILLSLWSLRLFNIIIVIICNGLPNFLWWSLCGFLQITGTVGGSSSICGTFWCFSLWGTVLCLFLLLLLLLLLNI